MLNLGLIGDIQMLEPFTKRAQEHPQIHIAGKSSVGTQPLQGSSRISAPEFNRIELIERSDALLINRFSLLPFQLICDIVKKSKHFFAASYPELTAEECSQILKLRNEAQTVIQVINPHTHMAFPLLGEIDFGLAYYPISTVVIAGMSNAVNLADGVDGLAGSMYIFSLAPMMLLPVWQNGIIAPICGALAGFLWHNWFPATVFMGDTGSISLGAMMAVMFALDGREGFLLFFGMMFLVEMFSVIIQVFSFKVFGKRVFRMSPIHHHFELLNWKESKIAFRFSLIAFIGAVFGLLSW